MKSPHMPKIKGIMRRRKQGAAKTGMERPERKKRKIKKEKRTCCKLRATRKGKRAATEKMQGLKKGEAWETPNP